ncbi:unnamed protein product [Trifolium pratense]|uniref:Uncharacterized protein n=1 Tax=Trifolium pratense TaxID=57577 RepID=A0ACB0JZ34_TRIPR|nr:unnamed protein product [Trifolium pratense]
MDSAAVHGWLPPNMVRLHFSPILEKYKIFHNPTLEGISHFVFFRAGVHIKSKAIQFKSNKSPQEFAEEVLKEAHLYNGFNLVLVDICTSTMVYVFNRPKSGYLSVTPGIHVLTNASLDTPWPKAERLRHSFKELIDEYGEGEFPIKEMVEKLMTNTIKDDEQCLLPGIRPPELEFPLSSIFVDIQLPLGAYGTRSSSALFVTSNKEVTFYEKHLDQKQWKENTVTYQISET